MRPEDRGVAGHLQMTPRQFVESLRHPIGSRSRIYGDDTPRQHGGSRGSAAENSLRLAEIAGWLWAEEKWPTYGAGGEAFMLNARLHVQKGDFIEWLDQLPQPKPKGAQRGTPS